MLLLLLLLLVLVALMSLRAHAVARQLTHNGDGGVQREEALREAHTVLDHVLAADGAGSVGSGGNEEQAFVACAGCGCGRQSTGIAQTGAMQARSAYPYGTWLNMENRQP